MKQNSGVTAKEAEDKAEEAYKGDSAYVKAKEVYNKALQSRIMAWEAFNKATDDYNEALNAYYEAWDAYFSKYTEELQILHNKMFPDCPWDGESIF